MHGTPLFAAPLDVDTAVGFEPFFFLLFPRSSDLRHARQLQSVSHSPLLTLGSPSLPPTSLSTLPSFPLSHRASSFADIQLAEGVATPGLACENRRKKAWLLYLTLLLPTLVCQYPIVGKCEFHRHRTASRKTTGIYRTAPRSRLDPSNRPTTVLCQPWHRTGESALRLRDKKILYRPSS